MLKSDCKEAFIKLGIFLNAHINGEKTTGLENFHDELDKIIQENHQYNGWFTSENIKNAVQGLSFMLKEEQLKRFWSEAESKGGKTIAVIMAGNIPAVGFHDLLCVLLSGHRILIKTSSDDQLLIPFLVKLLIHYNPEINDDIHFAEGKISQFDAVIATGNNNSAMHFEYYFSKYPHIIRKNRNSIGILTGNENTDDLIALGKDIFTYFGLGCRNVSKLFVPEGYSFNDFFQSMYEFRDVAQNKKYFNNYEYHRALFLLEKIDFLDNNFMILRKSESFSSPVAVIHYENYSDLTELKNRIFSHMDKIQCIVGKTDIEKIIPFGKSQEPGLEDFADGINTLEFLKTIG